MRKHDEKKNECQNKIPNYVQLYDAPCLPEQFTRVLNVQLTVRLLEVPICDVQEWEKNIYNVIKRIERGRMSNIRTSYVKAEWKKMRYRFSAMPTHVIVCK